MFLKHETRVDKEGRIVRNEALFAIEFLYNNKNKNVYAAVFRPCKVTPQIISLATKT